MKGRAAVFTQIEKPLEIREFPLPEVEPDAILVKVSLANICGSDLHFWRGKGPGIKGGMPIILGHEMLGRVERLGKNVKTDYLGQPLKEGDRIIYSYFRPCGRCWNCLSGEAACPYRIKHWIGIPCDEPPYFNGAFADYYYVRPGQWVFKVSDELPDEVISPVNCATAQVVYGLHKVGITLGDTVVIQGAGGLGLYAVAVAREMGAGQIIVVDKIRERLELAREFGADVILDASTTKAEERIQKVQDLTGGMGADVVAEFAGSPQVIDEGTQMLRFGGRYLWIGNINIGYKAEIDPAQYVRGTRTIFGVVAYQAWVIPRTLDFLKRTLKKYPYTKLVSHKFPLAEVNKAMEVALEGKAYRVALVPG